MSKAKIPGPKRGRGRPALQGKRKTSAFNTRLDEATRLGLERAAARSGRSLSHEIQHRLRQSLEAPPTRTKSFSERPEDHALAGLIIELASTIRLHCTPMPLPPERPSWRESPYFFTVLRIACLMLLQRLQPEGNLVVPAPVTQSVDHIREYSPEAFPRDMTPQQVAAWYAAVFVDAAWHRLLATNPPPFPLPENEPYEGNNYMPAWRKALGLNKGGNK
jgi:hypothetical protein